MSKIITSRSFLAASSERRIAMVNHLAPADMLTLLLQVAEEAERQVKLAEASLEASGRKRQELETLLDESKRQLKDVADKRQELFFQRTALENQVKTLKWAIEYVKQGAELKAKLLRIGLSEVDIST